MERLGKCCDVGVGEAAEEEGRTGRSGPCRKNLRGGKRTPTRGRWEGEVKNDASNGS